MQSGDSLPPVRVIDPSRFEEVLGASRSPGDSLARPPPPGDAACPLRCRKNSRGRMLRFLRNVRIRLGPDTKQPVHLAISPTFRTGKEVHTLFRDSP